MRYGGSTVSHVPTRKYEIGCSLVVCTPSFYYFFSWQMSTNHHYCFRHSGTFFSRHFNPSGEVDQRMPTFLYVSRPSIAALSYLMSGKESKSKQVSSLARPYIIRDRQATSVIRTATH